MEILSEALAARGHRVTLISGGILTDSNHQAYDYQKIQLPPVRVADGSFSELLTADGAAANAEFLRNRTEELMRAATAESPQVIIVETFPFGRRMLRYELTRLLKWARALQPRPLTLCSVRDILQTRSEQRMRETVQSVNEFLDGVLVHGDPAVAKLADTFPLSRQLRGEVFHSNYISRNQITPSQAARDEIIVSVGGGAVGCNVLQTAIAAKKILATNKTTALANMQWRILVGRNASRAQFHNLQRYADAGLTVEWNRADFVDCLRRCAVSVSQAGYNTVMDITAANCPAVFVPFARWGETEQRMRAEQWAAMGRAVVVDESKLDAARLAKAIARAATLDINACQPIKMNGADNSVDFIEEYYRRNRANLI